MTIIGYVEDILIYIILNTMLCIEFLKYQLVGHGETKNLASVPFYFCKKDSDLTHHI